MYAYYNEIDPFAAAWLRELIKAGHIAPGEVDERSITDVEPADLKGFTQCHFFAGIGVWSYALRQAGWADDRPVWTGSCPCQPFSSAGKGKGFADERHLWPDFHRLISQCRPPVCFGEQVASKDGLAWLDLVQADLEGANYAVGAVDTCAAGFGAPHIRQRLYWVADTESGRRGSSFSHSRRHEGEDRTSGMADGMANTLCHENREEFQKPTTTQREWETKLSGGCDPSCGMGNSDSHGYDEGSKRRSFIQSEEARRVLSPQRPDTRDTLQQIPSPTNGNWNTVDWLLCRDGKWRAVEPCTFPLAHGSPARVGRLRGYGNAIVAPQAKAFIEAYLEIGA